MGMNKEESFSRLNAANNATQLTMLRFQTHPEGVDNELLCKTFDRFYDHILTRVTNEPHTQEEPHDEKMLFITINKRTHGKLMDHDIHALKNIGFKQSKYGLWIKITNNEWKTMQDSYKLIFGTLEIKVEEAKTQ